MAAASSKGVGALLLALAIAAGSLVGQETGRRLDPARAVVLALPRAGDRGDEAAASRFAELLAAALGREARAAGLDASLIAPGSGLGEVDEAAAALAAAARYGARWALLAVVRVEGARVIWRTAFYDGSSGGLLGADSFSAYAGLSALPLLEGSAGAAVEAAMMAMSEPAALDPVRYRVELRSPDEGATASFGGRVLGRIEGGSMLAPYYPFETGDAVAIDVEKEGHWPRKQELRLSAEGGATELEPLFAKADMALGGSYGTGRMLGFAASFRWYPSPDLLYLRVEDSLWAAYDFSESARPALHDELRLGVAAYPFFDPNASFRASLGLGASLVGTFLPAVESGRRVGLDACVEPIFFTLEWHGPSWAIAFESRYPYSLGASTGFLPRGWLSIDESGPLFFSIGILFKR